MKCKKYSDNPDFLAKASFQLFKGLNGGEDTWSLESLDEKDFFVWNYYKSLLVTKFEFLKDLNRASFAI